VNIDNTIFFFNSASGMPKQYTPKAINWKLLPQVRNMIG